MKNFSFIDVWVVQSRWSPSHDNEIQVFDNEKDADWYIEHHSFYVHHWQRLAQHYKKKTTLRLNG